MRILVLDDHKGFRDEVLGMLARNGHEGDGVGTAVEAIPLVESGGYDFVMVDFSMPEHDGLWFMTNAKRPRHTKALLVTAHVYREVINKMFALGAVGYIIKPFDEEDLIRHLDFYSRSGGPNRVAP
jgi:CheY-like chemotaxis protein